MRATAGIEERMARYQAGLPHPRIRFAELQRHQPPGGAHHLEHSQIQRTCTRNLTPTIGRVSL